MTTTPCPPLQQTRPDTQHLAEPIRAAWKQLHRAVAEAGDVAVLNAAELYAVKQERDQLREALTLAVNLLAVNEPGDSRAVSDEFVALAAVSTGDASREVMAIIRAANARTAEPIGRPTCIDGKPCPSICSGPRSSGCDIPVGRDYYRGLEREQGR